MFAQYLVITGVAPAERTKSMERHRKIDKSLQERRSILNLLEKLKRDNISVDEMEEIGSRLRKAGGRALSPLVRRLWREKDGDVISRYAYLLDFFEDDAWLDQLIKIALTRKDLEEEGKSAFLAALEGYGVDVSLPPFAKILEEVGGPLRLTLPKLLDKGEKGTVIFMEGFVSYSLEVQQALIREMPLIDDPRIIGLLSLLLRFDDPVIAGEAADALGRIRHDNAATALTHFYAVASEDLRPLVERSLRRLAFLGIKPADGETEKIFPFRTAYVSPVDGSGVTCLFISRWCSSDRLNALFVEINETVGMRDAWGWSSVTEEECESIIRDMNVGEGMVTVDPSYAVLLVRDAMSRSIRNDYYLPPEFYVRRGIFEGVDLAPAPYIPSFDGFDLAKVASPKRILECESILDDPFFDGWFVSNRLMRDLSVELESMGNDLVGRGADAATERLLEKFCRERISPDLDRVVRRLFLVADLMQKAGREPKIIARTLAAALSLSHSTVPFYRHPFIRRYLLELIEMVGEARAEGFDLRFSDYDDDYDGEWE